MTNHSPPNIKKDADGRRLRREAGDLISRPFASPRSQPNSPAQRAPGPLSRVPQPDSTATPTLLLPKEPALAGNLKSNHDLILRATRTAREPTRTASTEPPAT